MSSASAAGRGFRDDAPVDSGEYRAARESLGFRVRASAAIDVAGEDRVSFLQGQLTQEMRGLGSGDTRPAAGLTPKGKLIFVARVVGLPDRIRLLLQDSARIRVLEHLHKYAMFQKVAIEDRTDEVLRVGLYGPGAAAVDLENVMRLSGEGEFSAELLSSRADRDRVERFLRDAGGVGVDDPTAEALRIEAGRPRFGVDGDESNLADELGLAAAISTTKGCYVGQEVVARIRTYGRVNRRLVGYRFAEGALPAGEVLMRAEETEPGKIEWGRVTSSAVSPRFGAIGLGFAFREIAVGERLVGGSGARRGAVVVDLPFA